jgi:hypothetical protein
MRRFTIAFLIAAGPFCRAPAGDCVLDWGDGFAAPGVYGGGFDSVRALALFDDGSGPALYAGGSFSVAGDVFASYIAKWDGANWSGWPGAIWYDVNALAIFDYGTGPRIYAGHDAGVQSWDGRNWSVVGGVSGAVYALAGFDDGSGPALYVGGDFHAVEGIPAWRIARWDGSNWSALGTFSNEVRALAVYDPPGPEGPALYAAGLFAGVNGEYMYCISKWDGSTWSALGEGLGPYYARAYALAVYDDGEGLALYVGGVFATAGGISANSVARWDGSSWSALGEGVGDGEFDTVFALGVFDDGSGPALYAGGDFDTAGGLPASRIAKWNGTTWSAVDTGIAGDFWGPEVYALGAFDLPGTEGPALYAGGTFASAGGVGADQVARWDGTSWSALGAGNGLNNDIRALTVFDPGGAEGPGLYAAGDFASAGAAPAYYVARWDGQGWSVLGDGLDTRAHALAVFDPPGGEGPALYVGKSINGFEPPELHGIERWDGQNWSDVGGGLGGGIGWGPFVRALGVFDDGWGPGLYAGGLFTSAGGVPARCIAKWDGSSWSALGSGLDTTIPYSHPEALAIAGFDDGHGPALYVGGHFTLAGAVPAQNIARWDGTAWSALPGDPDDYVLALAVFDDGRGPALYAGGDFDTIGGAPMEGIARWNGQNWSSVGGGLDGGASALAVFDDGSGPALYATGGIYSAGGVPANDIAKWDGRRWWPLGDGLDIPSGEGLALAAYDDGSGPALYAGGYFLGAGGKVSARIAKWGCVPGLTLGDADCNGVVDNFDIQPFVLALCRPEEYAAQYPNCDPRTADANRDGRVNDFDITPFVHLLVGK